MINWLKFLIYNYNNLVESGLLMPIHMHNFLGSINIHDLYMKAKVTRKKSIYSVQLAPQ